MTMLGNGVVRRMVRDVETAMDARRPRLAAAVAASRDPAEIAWLLDEDAAVLRGHASTSLVAALQREHQVREQRAAAFDAALAEVGVALGLVDEALAVARRYAPGVEVVQPQLAEVTVRFPAPGWPK